MNHMQSLDGPSFGSFEVIRDIPKVSESFADNSFDFIIYPMIAS